MEWIALLFVQSLTVGVVTAAESAFFVRLMAAALLVAEVSPRFATDDISPCVMCVFSPVFAGAAGSAGAGVGGTLPIYI